MTHLMSSDLSETLAPTDKHAWLHDSVECNLNIHSFDNLKFIYHKLGVLRFFRNVGAIYRF
jgi:hypothetical protein